MRLRPYTAADLSAISDICATCNVGDTLSRYMTRDISTYWTSYRLSTVRGLRDQIAMPGHLCWVAVCDAGDLDAGSNPVSEAEAGKVVGWIVCSRKGKSEVARRWMREKEGWGWKLERMLYGWEEKYFNLMPNVNPSRNQKNRATVQPILSQMWDEHIFAEAWEINGLCVDEAWQRRGIGSMLIGWVVERAGEEGVPAVVGSSPAGGRGYEKAGFRQTARLPFDDYFETGGRGFWSMVWEPPGGKGRWWERAVEKEKERQRVKDDERESKEQK